MIILLSAILAQGEIKSEDIEPGNWSSAAYFVWPIDREASKEYYVLSPDKNWKSTIGDHFLTLTAKKNSIKNKTLLDGIAEIGWASDSSALFLTQSDGGLVGSWYVRIIQMKDQRQKEIDITKQAAKDYYKHISKCPDEEPNIVALGWLEGSRKLLVVAETPNHSSCPDMGNIAGYLVAVPSGKILRKYNKQELKTNFENFMGPRLKGKYEEN